MQSVDLTLAVNYLPACGCLVKLIVFLIVLAMIPPGEEVPSGYLVLAAGLYMDRTLAHNIIFDGNAILMAVFVANVHAAIRAFASTMTAFPAVIGGGHLLWAAACAILIADPPLVRQVLETQASKRLPPGGKLTAVCAMLVVTVVTAHFRCELEPTPIRACRALAFTLLSFAWIYMIGIHSSQGVGHLKENSWQFIARLAPILYSPIWVAALFAPAIMWALAMQHASPSQKQAHGASPYQYAPLLPVQSEDPTTVTNIPQPPAPAAKEESSELFQQDPEAQLVEELLRQAKQQASATTTKGRALEVF
jgi:hypothetical protein